MAFKPNVNFGASNVIDPTAGARQALQSVGGLLDAYGKRQQSTQEMLLREQGRQDTLVQQALANKRADAQLQLSQNQDTRAAEKSAQDTEEFGIKKNTQKQVADYTQQAQGAQVGGLTTTQGLDLSNKFDAMLASGMSGEQAAAATQSASEAVMASNLKDPGMGAQFLAEIKQPSFGDVDSAKLSDLQRVTAQPFEKKIETANQQAFQADQNERTRKQSAAQFNQTQKLHQAKEDRDLKTYNEGRDAVTAMVNQGNISLNPEAVDYLKKEVVIPLKVKEVYAKMDAGTATDADKAIVDEYNKATEDFANKALATRVSTTVETLQKAVEADPSNATLAKELVMAKQAQESAIAKEKSDLAELQSKLAIEDSKVKEGDGSTTASKAAKIDDIYDVLGVKDPSSASSTDKAMANKMLAAGLTVQQASAVAGDSGFKTTHWGRDSTYDTNVDAKLDLYTKANTPKAGGSAEIQKQIESIKSRLDAYKTPIGDKDLVKNYEKTVNALGVEKADESKDGGISDGSDKTALQRNVVAGKDSSELTIEQLSNPATLTDAQFKVAVEFASKPSPLLSNHIADSFVKAAIRTEAAKRENIVRMKDKDAEISRLKNEIASTKSHSKLEQLNADLLVAQGRRALGL
jgi:hypothetical protein